MGDHSICFLYRNMDNYTFLDYPWYPFLSGALRPDFTSNLVHGLAFRTPKFYIVPYSKIKQEFINLSYNCDVKLGLRAFFEYQ